MKWYSLPFFFAAGMIFRPVLDDLWARYQYRKLIMKHRRQK